MKAYDWKVVAFLAAALALLLTLTISLSLI
jgi:hypothetical protein